MNNDPCSIPHKNTVPACEAISFIPRSHAIIIDVDTIDYKGQYIKLTQMEITTLADMYVRTEQAFIFRSGVMIEVRFGK